MCVCVYVYVYLYLLCVVRPRQCRAPIYDLVNSNIRRS